MNWDAIGAAGEVLGALAVIISIIYLSRQIHQNSESTKSAAVQAVLENLNRSLNVGAYSKETAKVIVEGQTHFENLEDAEKYQFALWMISYFRSMELAHEHYLKKEISESTWEGIEFQIASLLQAESVRRVWKARKGVYNKCFQEFVETLMDSDAGISAAASREIVFGPTSSHEN